MEAYTYLCKWFEKLNEDCGYTEWSQYLINKLKSLGAGASGIDIGCGSGYFTRALNKEGFNVKGIDISAQSLDVAQRLALAEGVRTEFLLGDITKLKLNFKCDFAVAVNDCLNYVEKDKLKNAFSSVKNCLKKGGIFIFDISSGYKLKTVIGNNVFCEDGEDISYIWFNRLKRDRVVMDLTIFERRQDGLYNRYDETHTQYIHEESDICSALRSAGFDVTSERIGKNKKERINFICTANE